jgi:hypothetical protein
VRSAARSGPRRWIRAETSTSFFAVVRLRGFDTSPRDFRAGFASVDTKRARVKRSKPRKFHFRDVRLDSAS